MLTLFFMYHRFPESMLQKPSDVLSIGQEITAKVVDFNGEDKKISLSMKALESAAPAEEEEPVEE